MSSLNGRCAASKDKNDSGLIDKEEFIKALQNPEELLAKPEEKKELFAITDSRGVPLFITDDTE